MLPMISMQMRRFLKPIVMLMFFKRVKAPLFVTGCVLFSMLLLWVMYLPGDFDQGSVFKIMYVHVPASWWALGIYVIMSFQAILGFVFRLPQCHLMAKNWAIAGLFMTILSLVTGMIWGKLTWGTYWVWDARLTTMFIQLMIYLGYVYITHIDDTEKSHMVGSILLVIGLINLPMIKYSVDWWLTLHQPASIKILSKNTIHQTYFLPLILGWVTFFILAASYFAHRMTVSLQHKRHRSYFLG